MPQFCHLHCHTQFSLLDGASKIPQMVAKAKADGQRAVAITDHGNMFGAFRFVEECNKQGVIPIVGCEFYVVEDRHVKKFTQNKKDKRYHQLILAKDQNGYNNLSKLCSLGFTEGYYSKYPRIDKELIKKYSEGLIATTCCIGAEIPQTIIHHGVEKGEEVFKEWLDIFGEDYYIELQRHHIKNIDNSGISQEDLNQILLGWSEKYNVPAIATNDSHYVEEDDSNAHDILLCVNTGELKSTPIASQENYGKPGYRFGFPNDQFFFKTQDQMTALFNDIPHVVDNTQLIVDKITPPVLKRDVLLPNYALPAGFNNQDEYLKFLAYEGAKKRYGVITAEIEERINFELATIKASGYPGYFLIVQDFTTAARNMGVRVGPGRGSAAGSVVAYCVGITNVDPLKYNLLFERFLNPDRISMPDIDIDFDDRGRQKVIDYVVDLYGKNQVAQIITYGSMAAKGSLRDVARVLDLPLNEVNGLTKEFPQNLSASLNKILGEGGIQEKLKKKMNAEDLAKAAKIIEYANGNDLKAQTINQAKVLEGTVRNTGVHACGVIITPDDITKFVPVATAKDSDLVVTQFDNNVVEKAGLLKMDFLGLKTLTIINDAVELIEQNHGVKIDPDLLSLEDEKTFELFQEGRTKGIFQFESPGMRKHLINLKPNRFEDLIAMNALYRPGPMQYIGNFIARKHGKEVINYDHPLMEEHLAETFGITVYQEQVMLLSQKLAGFTKGQADNLRKAMGKKIRSMMDELKPLFEAGCTKNGIEDKIVQKIWKDWEEFASYAFNKSHSTCYALLAFQTAYLKANYPAEFMASLLTNNRNSIDKVTIFMQEAKRMGIDVKRPDINESQSKFTVNKKGEVRFALMALKGVGSSAAEDIVKEREENGDYKSFWEFCRRVNLRSVNKSTFESLAKGGAFDCFEGTYRSQYFHRERLDGMNIIELAIKYGSRFQQSINQNQSSLFGDNMSIEIAEPPMPQCEKYTLMELLKFEKEVVGIYLSGHPLDEYEIEMNHFIDTHVKDVPKLNDQSTSSVGGMMKDVRHRITKTGKPFGLFKLEDYTGEMDLALFGDDYMRYKNYLENGTVVYVFGKYKSRWGDSDEKEFKVLQIKLLRDITNKMSNSLSIEADLNALTKTSLDQLVSLFKNNKGNNLVKFKIRQKEKKFLIGLTPRKMQVEISNELLEGLDKLEGFEYNIQKTKANTN